MSEVDDHAGASPPRDAFDHGGLTRWLEANVACFQGPAEVSQFAGGQSNPTYRIRSPSGAYVLRRKPLGVLLPSAHAVDREFRVLRALAGSGVPVPAVHALCQDDGVIGSAFYVMDLVPGRVFWDPRLPELATADRGVLFRSMNRTIADLHRIDPDAVGLGDFGRPGAFLERQIARWSKQYRASETETIESMDALIGWLPRNIPPEGEVRIVHGDYRLDNLIVHPDRPEVAAVLDWELATLGDPLADFAYHVMSWRFTPELFRGLAGSDLGALGIPQESDYVAEYCERTGRRGIEGFDVYICFSMFRIAAILQGIAKRAQDGTAASTEAETIGRKARPIADQAWAIARAMG